MAEHANAVQIYLRWEKESRYYEAHVEQDPVGQLGAYPSLGAPKFAHGAGSPGSLPSYADAVGKLSTIQNQRLSEPAPPARIQAGDAAMKAFLQYAAGSPKEMTFGLAFWSSTSTLAITPQDTGCFHSRPTAHGSPVRASFARSPPGLALPPVDILVRKLARLQNDLPRNLPSRRVADQVANPRLVRNIRDRSPSEQSATPEATV
jgi:hypothetical protein